jgi:Protein of unknown function (DUF3489)
MYGAAKAHDDRLDRPPDLKNRGFSEAVGSDIDLGRERIVADRQQPSRSDWVPPRGARAGSGDPMTGSTPRSSMMTDKPRKLSNTARTLLTAAAMRDDHLIAPPKLPVAAARQVVRSLLNAGFAEEVPAPVNDPSYAWRTGADRGVLALQATALGIGRALEGEGDATVPAPIMNVAESPAERVAVRAGGAASIARTSTVDPFAATQPSDRAPVGQDRPDSGVTAPALVLAAEASRAAGSSARPAGGADSLRRAAQALLDAWDNAGGGHDSLDEITGPITALRAALGFSASIANQLPRPETKQAQVLTMLARDEGVSGPQIAEAMGWAPHTVRGFLAGLAKKGIKVEVLERVRQVGPNKQGAKGSYSVYRLAAEAEG